MGLVRTVAKWSATGKRCRGGDAGVGDHGFLGHLQRHFAHVPAGQVRGGERFFCGHAVADCIGRAGARRRCVMAKLATPLVMSSSWAMMGTFR